MSGYTPLYDTLLTGTLYGRWPHVGVWACLLSRVSREGVIDERPEMLAAMMGIDVDTLVRCMNDFMQPDPGSRTSAHEGRRLALIDPMRDWGWKVLNHSKYKEKARKHNYDSDRTASGVDAERKKREREVGTRPDVSREVPLSSPSPSPSPSPTPPSESPTRGDRERDVAEAKGARTLGSRIPLPFVVTDEMVEWAKLDTPNVDVKAATAEFEDYWRGVAGQKARKTDWVATWRNRMRECESRSKKSNGQNHAATTRFDRIRHKG